MTDRPPPPPKQKGSRPQSARAYTELIEIQGLLLARMRLSEERTSCVAACARAYCDCEERKRILKGKPGPGNLRPDLQQKKPRRSSGAQVSPVLPTDGSAQREPHNTTIASSDAPAGGAT